MSEENEADDIFNEFEDDLLEEESKPKGKKKLKIALVLLILIVVGGGGYYTYSILTFEPPPPFILPVKKPPSPPFAAKTDTPVEENLLLSDEKSLQDENVPPSTFPDEQMSEQPSTVVQDQIPQSTLLEESTAQSDIREIPDTGLIGQPLVEDEQEPAPEEFETFTSEKEIEVRDYIVQIGTYVFKKSSELARKIVSDIGYDVYEEKKKANISRYQLLIGEFQDAEELREIVKRLSSDGVQVKFEKFQDESYTIAVDSYFSSSKAEEVKKDLILKGYPARISVTTEKMDVYALRIEGKHTKSESKEIVNRLKGAGVNPLAFKL